MSTHDIAFYEEICKTILIIIKYHQIRILYLLLTLSNNKTIILVPIFHNVDVNFRVSSGHKNITITSNTTSEDVIRMALKKFGNQVSDLSRSLSLPLCLSVCLSPVTRRQKMLYEWLRKKFRNQVSRQLDLGEAILMNIYNIGFYGEIEKIVILLKLKVNKNFHPIFISEFSFC